MNDYIQQLITYLDKALVNLEDFMTGQLIPFDDDTFLKKDAVYPALNQPPEFNADAQVFLSVIIPAMTALLKNIMQNISLVACLTTSNQIDKSAAKHN